MPPAVDPAKTRLIRSVAGVLVRALKASPPPRTDQGRHNPLYRGAFRPHGKRPATGDRAGTVALWEAASGKLLHQSPGPAFYSYAQIQGGSEYEWGGVRA